MRSNLNHLVNQISADYDRGFRRCAGRSTGAHKVKIVQWWSWKRTIKVALYPINYIPSYRLNFTFRKNEEHQTTLITKLERLLFACKFWNYQPILSWNRYRQFLPNNMNRRMQPRTLSFINQNSFCAHRMNACTVGTSSDLSNAMWTSFTREFIVCS